MMFSDYYSQKSAIPQAELLHPLSNSNHLRYLTNPMLKHQKYSASLMSGISLMTIALSVGLPTEARAGGSCANTTSFTTGATGCYNSGNLTSLTNSGSSITAVSSSGITITPGGTILGSSYGIRNNNSAVIGDIGNSGAITGFVAISNNGTFKIINNKTAGTINGTLTAISNSNTGSISSLINSGSISDISFGINNSGTIGALSNNGTIGDFGGGQAGIQNTGNISTITNTGDIQSWQTGILNNVSGSIQTLINATNGTIEGAYGIENYSFINTINNQGSIDGRAIGVFNSGSIDALTNSGTISGNLVSGSNAFGVNNSGTIGLLTNFGTISGGNQDINNSGTITTLNNLQGASSSALTYSGNLPTNYNIIINGPSNYGKLAASNSGSSQMTFGISSLSTGVRPGVYTGVLTGVSASNIVNTTGKIGVRGVWTLTDPPISWDLTISGAWNQFIGFDNPNVANTYTAVISNQQATEGILHQRYAVLNAVMQYDCDRFDKYGVCIQFQTRATGYGTQATGSGILNASYRIANKFRVGAYLDYQAFQGNPFGMNIGSGGVQQGYNNPTFGGYIGYNDNPDETGIQARVSGGYNPGQVNVVRAVMSGTEPGFGNAMLNAYYAYGVAGYGIKIGNGLVVTPYGGLQYTDVTRNAFTEQYNPAVTMFPLAYNAYYERLITGLAGAKIKGMFNEKLGYQMAMGGQFDFNRSANSYGGYSFMPSMEAFGVAHGQAWNGVRPAGMAGVFYDPIPNHRISVNAYASQQAWSTRTYTTGLLGYQIAF